MGHGRKHLCACRRPLLASVGGPSIHDDADSHIFRLLSSTPLITHRKDWRYDGSYRIIVVAWDSNREGDQHDWWEENSGDVSSSVADVERTIVTVISSSRGLHFLFLGSKSDIGGIVVFGFLCFVSVFDSEIESQQRRVGHHR